MKCSGRLQVVQVQLEFTLSVWLRWLDACLVEPESATPDALRSRFAQESFCLPGLRAKGLETGSNVKSLWWFLVKGIFSKPVPKPFDIL